jgi:hypothetical protein
MAMERRFPGHEHVPRHHGLPGDRARRGRLLGQRDPLRHLEPGRSGPGRRGHRSQLRLLALGHLQQRRHEGDLHRRVGRGERAALPGHRPPEWGANAIFDIVDGRMQLASYYKLPAPQTELENCVAHNGSLVPVPGRDIKVQAWYQGGVSVFDFTDSANPVEIAFFDRGPLSARRSSPAATGPPTGTTDTSTGRRSRGASTCWSWCRASTSRENELAAARPGAVRRVQPSAPAPDALAGRNRRGEGVLRSARPARRAPADPGRGARELDRIDGMADGAGKRAALAELAVQLWADARAVDQGEPGEAERIRRLAGSLLDLAAAQR